MGQKYNAVLVSKTTSRDVVKEIVKSLDDLDLNNISETDLVESLKTVVYNKLRRQANVDKLTVDV